MRSSHRLLHAFLFVAVPLAGALGSARLLSPPVHAQQGTASGIELSALDRGTEPCTDFYQYACGGWIKANPIPADQAAWGRANELDLRNREVLRSILEEAAALPKPEADSKKIGDFWQSCMDEAEVNRRGAAPLEPEMARIDTMRTRADLIAEIAHLHDTGVDVLFEFGAEPDFKDARNMIAGADQGGIGLPDRDYYLKDDEKSRETRKKYVTHVTNILALLGEPADRVGAEAQGILELETALARASLDRVTRRDPAAVYHPMTPDQVSALTPAFDWKAYLAGIRAPRLTSVNVAVPDFFKAMNDLVASRPVDSFKPYLRWHVVHSDVRWLAAPFYDENFSFYGKTLTGQSESQPRWKRCVQYTDSALGEALGRYYVERTFGAEGKARVLEMVQAIERAMQADIRDIDWMTDATKQQALVKLHAVVNKIGYPDRWRDYSALSIARGDLLGNGVRGRAFEVARDLAKIGKPVDRSEWALTPQTLNAYYSPLENNINFPAGILQPPFFDRAATPDTNFGAIGAIIGHELTHGFDDKGRQFDADGNLRDWWTAADAKAFDERASCVADEYSQFTAVDDVKINGQLTLGENVADNGGLRLAHMAVRQAAGGQGATVDGFTPDQRFFIAYAQAWCEARRPEYARLLATIDPHSTSPARVNGVVSNMPEFQKAFSCKADAPMVRPKMCRVW